LAKLSTQERLLLRERLRLKLDRYTFEDLVELISDLLPRKIASGIPGRPVQKLTQSPIRATIAEFLVPLLREQGGASCLTAKGGLRPGPIREAYLEWYLNLRGEKLLAEKESRTMESVKALALIQAREALRSHAEHRE